MAYRGRAAFIGGFAPGPSLRNAGRFLRSRKEGIYLRPRYILAKAGQVLTHPGEAKRIIKAGVTLLKYLFVPSLKK